MSLKPFISVLLFCYVISYLLSVTADAASDERIYVYHSKKGIPSFSDVPPVGLSYEIARMDCYACEVESHINWHKAELYLTLFSDVIDKAATINNIDAAFVRAVIHAESHFNTQAVSKQGAQGLMQLMPTTAEELGVKNAFIAEQNIQGGVKHLARLLKKYNGNARMASAAYNAGESAVKKFKGIPPYPETKVYVERVEILRKRYLRANNI